MRKQRRNWPDQHPVSHIDQQRFRGDISTVCYNVAAVVVYAVLLNSTLSGTTGLIAFFVLAVLQMAVCFVIAVNYNSKMWLYSALSIFVLSCVAFIYVNS